MINKALAKRERIAPSVITLDDRYAPMLEITDIRNEEACIGAVLQKPELYVTLAEIVQPSDFFFLKNGYIWKAFDELSNARQGIDLVTVPDAMQALNAPIQGEDLIRELARMIGSAPDNRNAETYARAVFNSAIRLRLLASATEISQIVRDKTRTIDAVVDQCDQLIYKATGRKTEASSSIRSAMVAYADKVEAKLEAGELSPGIPLGSKRLDAKMGGLYPNEVCVFAGGEGSGKTTWVLSHARNIAQRGHKVALFTLEMTQEEILRIFTAMETGIYRSVLKSFSLSSYQWGLFTKASGDIGNWNMDVIDEYPTLTPIQCRRKLRTICQSGDVELVVIDGLWLMEADEPSKDRWRDVTVIMRELNQIARDFQAPVLITHQYKGQIVGKPTIYDLSESAGVRRNAQMIFGLHRPPADEEGVESAFSDVYVLKDRNGSLTGEKFEYVYDEGHDLYREMGS